MNTNMIQNMRFVRMEDESIQLTQLELDARLDTVHLLAYTPQERLDLLMQLKCAEKALKNLADMVQDVVAEQHDFVAVNNDRKVYGNDYGTLTMKSGRTTIEVDKAGLMEAIGEGNFIQAATFSASGLEKVVGKNIMRMLKDNEVITEKQGSAALAYSYIY